MKTVKIRIALDDCIGSYGIVANIKPVSFGEGVCEGCSFWSYCYLLREIQNELSECKKY